MDEYIKREYAVDAVLDVYYDTPDIDLSGEKFESAILKIPAADVAPVRHGHWISLTECANEGVYCSICKKKVWKSDYAWCSKKSRNKLRSNYCPNCGAKMDGGDGNSDMA